MYMLKAETLPTRIGESSFATLREARIEAKNAASSAFCEPARVGIYRDAEPVEVWEDGKKVWRNAQLRQAQYEARQRAKGMRMVSVRLDPQTFAVLNEKAAKFGGDYSSAIRAALLS